MVQHGGDHRLRRLRRLVRPRLQRRAQSAGHLRVANPPGPQDFLSGTGLCASKTAPRLAGQNGRCGYGPRMPLLVISPWSRQGVVSHNITDLSSIPKFVEDNWGLARNAGSFDAIAGSLNPMFDFDRQGNRGGRLFLDPVTGQPTRWSFR